MMTMPRFVAMIANQRSGTHLIRGCTNDHPSVFCPAEPLFHTFLQTDDEMQVFLKQYQGVEREVVLIDIKYNQITPPVERWLKRQRVLHLIRRDVKRQFFSRQLRNWMAANDGDKRGIMPLGPNPPHIPFDEAQFRQYAETVRKHIARFTPLETTRLYFEDLTHNKCVISMPEWAGRILCALMEVPYQRMVTRTRKESPENMQEGWL